jgi:hypothetical protein
MSRFLLIASCPWVRVIVPSLSWWANLMVSPGLALTITARSVPLEPSSAGLVTIRVLRTVRSSRASSLGMNERLR